MSTVSTIRRLGARPRTTGSRARSPRSPSTTAAGTAYPILTVDTGTGRRPSTAHTVLRSELAKLDIQVGERVVILYGGKRRSKDGSTEYESYRAKAPDREPRRFAWGDSENGDATSGDDLVDTAPPAVVTTSVDDSSGLPF